MPKILRFKLKMHQSQFDSQALPKPTWGLRAFSRPLAAFWEDFGGNVRNGK